jgi:hypothetical protein
MKDLIRENRNTLEKADLLDAIIFLFNRHNLVKWLISLTIFG